MRIKFQIIFLFLLALQVQVNAQQMTPEQYVQQYKDLAIREMKRMGVPAAITLAQGLLETESGNSELLKKSNNHFGIKCKDTWAANGVKHDDDAPGECFRTYKDAEASYRDHSIFLRGSDRYAFLFDIDPADYKAWARGLKTAGYATNPRYPDILIKNIEQYNLQQYTLAAVHDVPHFETKKYQSDKLVKVVTDSVKAFQPAEKKEPLNEKVASDISASDVLGTRPELIQSINGTKCVYARKGTSLLLIASENNIALEKLLDYNDLEKDGLLKQDSYIFLAKKSKTGSTDFYVARQNESLYTVAQKNGIQLSALNALNPTLNGKPLPDGAKVYLKPHVNEVPATVQAHATPEYEVQPREGLYAIAKRNNVSVQQLREWNHLNSDTLNIGQKLIIKNKSSF